MKILQLIIKQKFYDEIIAGTKKQEFREVKPTTYKKYCEVDEEGFAVMKNGKFVPKKYDAIQFYVGYHPDRSGALVEVKGAEIVVFEDENHEIITYKHNGEEYIAAQIIYDLGKVIEK